MTFTDGAIRVLMKATLYAMVLVGAVTMDSWYAEQGPKLLCLTNVSTTGHWDCWDGRHARWDGLDRYGRVGSGALHR